ncbi:MAG: hypothetical protein V1753_01340, partial [Pseudomonadota bacterium]
YFFRPASGGLLTMVMPDSYIKQNGFFPADQISRINAALNASGFNIVSEAGRSAIIGTSADKTVFPNNISYYAFAKTSDTKSAWEKWEDGTLIVRQ